MILEETVPDALAGERLDRFLTLLLGSSRSDAAAVVAAGAVALNGVVVHKPALRVAAGDTVRVEVPEQPHAPPVEPEAGIDVEVVYEDPDLMVVDKPAGLVVHPGAGHAHGTLVNALVARHPEIAEVGDPLRPGIVHRLDKGTSGLLVVARTAAAYEALVAMMARHEVERTYRALVWGRPEARRGVIDAPIGRSGREPTKMAVSERGRRARTAYEVVATYDQPAALALLVCRLETGRTHQIRVHLAAIGHPVVGDARYGGNRAALRLPRPFLHAAELSFRHPLTGEQVHCVSELPADLRQVLDHLGGR